MGASKKITPRRLIVFLFCAAVLVIAQPHPVLVPIGSVLIILGEALRIWACGHLRKNKDVITSGPFAHVKNPLYLGTFLIMTGLCLATSNPWPDPETGKMYLSRYVLYVGLPLFLAVFVFYYFPYKVRVEGDRLRRRFGEKFDDYDKSVPNFFPRLTPYKKAVKASWEGKLVLENSELGPVVFLALGALIVFLKVYLDLWSI